MPSVVDETTENSSVARARRLTVFLLFLDVAAIVAGLVLVLTSGHLAFLALVIVGAMNLAMGIRRLRRCNG